MTKVLISGAGGFLGTVLVRQLQQHTSYALRCVDRFDRGAAGLSSVVTSAELMRGTICDPCTVRTVLEGVDLIVHLAAIVGYPACDASPIDADTTNVEGTRILCQEAHGRPILFASTGSTYGAVSGVCDETTPIHPLTRYGRNKRDGEALVLAAGGTCLRLATLFGLSPTMRWDLLPNDFSRTAVREGKLVVYEPHARRTFLHVEDAAAAFRIAIDGRLGQGVWNIGADWLNLTKLEIAQLIQAETGCAISEGEGSDPDARDYAVSYEKIAVVGAWVPLHGMGAGIRQLVKVARIWD